MHPASLFRDDPDDVEKVGAALDAAEYTTTTILGAIGPDGPALLARNELEPLLWRTRSATPLDTLVRLFLCETSVGVTDAERALAPLPLARWAEAGIVAVAGDQVTALVVLQPLEVSGRSCLLAHDGKARDGSADWVMGISASSRTLAEMTVRPSVRRALDVGTGSGVQALQASSHAEHVVATDTNRRALALAELTMALNGIGNVSTRHGSLFDPVVDERFDLIVANPPFVISPESRFDYRDSGLPSDELCRRIVAAAPRHLEERGWCQLAASWAHTAATPWDRRLAGWFEGTGCDAWVIQRSVHPVDAYAAMWIRNSGRDSESASQSFGQWMAYYERLGIEAVGFGLITMRPARGATPWVRVEELTHDLGTSPGSAIAAGFERLGWLAEVGDDPRRLLEARLLVGDAVRLDQRCRWAPGGWTLDEAWLRQLGPLGFSGSIDPDIAALLTGCDGSNRLGDVVCALAGSAGTPPEDLALQVVPIVHQLVERGFLVPSIPPDQ